MSVVRPGGIGWRLDEVVVALGAFLRFFLYVGFLHRDESLSGAGIEVACNPFHIRGENRGERFGGVDFLFGMGDAEEFVQFWPKANLRAPPVVVVLAAFLPHEEPASINFPVSTYNRHPCTL